MNWTEAADLFLCWTESLYSDRNFPHEPGPTWTSQWRGAVAGRWWGQDLIWFCVAIVWSASMWVLSYSVFIFYFCVIRWVWSPWSSSFPTGWTSSWRTEAACWVMAINSWCVWPAPSSARPASCCWMNRRPTSTPCTYPHQNIRACASSVLLLCSFVLTSVAIMKGRSWCILDHSRLPLSDPGFVYNSVCVCVCVASWCHSTTEVIHVKCVMFLSLHMVAIRNAYGNSVCVCLCVISWEGNHVCL